MIEMDNSYQQRETDLVDGIVINSVSDEDLDIRKYGEGAIRVTDEGRKYVEPSV
ncbi:MAG: hypothetical protein SVQ76_02780 [Candidatus Nanohaloarchaea archaeon]|nr:hypothetical protein [Candidatus Nanohaloarchaea archaeon]